ncbi:dihydroorotate dehydrogenase electron transfer subunit [Fusibacter paucivorans]|uniref:Dihydroorotate dehydrogenase electron transfer subunit n=1 Tax=Fusibacter paucivorans TaxID=76009 RepID=A0ABS5PSM7_9FIRM|nr:dihydroorotate dehydrogenase electron transfer subunit [Fusibacter paucivorans]MBS7528170.1 dihydroorotate dehydrogenase electron transfer subunit [Fusibacter paucivorans]
MKFQGLVRIISKKEINDEVFTLCVERPKAIESIKAGQFFNIKTSAYGSPMLRRPISVSGYDKDSIEFTIKVIGDGTKQLHQYEVDEKIDIMGPLGNGFEYSNEQEILVIGGGIGIAPVKGLLEVLKRENPNIKVTTILGFKDEPYLEETFNALSDTLKIVSETDSRYEKGFVTEPLKSIIWKPFQMTYACGPTPMLKAITPVLNAAKMPVQLLMEEKMACGIGACLVCTCKIKEGDFGYKHQRMCKDGPMFYGSEVIFDA